MSMARSLSSPPSLMATDEFYDWSSGAENSERGFELVRGRVIEGPPPNKTHGVISGNIAGNMWNYCRQSGQGYITTNDAGTLLEKDPDTVRGPDVADFTDAETFAELHPKYGEVPPVLAVEVLSPSDKVSNVLRKVNDYLDNGVAVVWLVDPEEEVVQVFRPGQRTITLSNTEEIDGGTELPGFSCKLEEFFRLPRVQARPPDDSHAPITN